MIPNFALNLSEDGIVLLHRHPSGAGWVEVADAPLDSADLGAALSGLRDKAEALGGPDFTTKLILPPSQLLYATIQVGDDVKADVEHALEDRTPYTAAQLNYDISGSAPEVQVVAVARETLEEAEAFLGPYGFNAVGFTALPDPTHFDGAPNLGALPSIGGNGIEDNSALKILSAEEVAALDTPEPEPATEVVEEPKDEIEPAVEAESLPADAPIEKAEGPIEAKAEDTATDDTPDLPVTPPAAFSSRRKPVLGPAKDVQGDLISSRAPRIAIATDKQQEAAPKKTAPRVEPRVKTGEAAKGKATPAIVPPKSVAPVAPTSAQTVQSGPTRLENGMATLRATAKKAKERRAEKKANSAQDAAVTAGAKADPIAELAARQATGKPRFLGLILTGLLILVLLAFAALSSYLLPENAVSRFFGNDNAEVDIAAATEGLIEPDSFENNERLVTLPAQSVAEKFLVPSEDEIAESEVPEPEFAPILEMSLTEAETAYAVSGVWQMAPNLRPELSREDLDDLYETSLDPELAFEDAPALASFDTAALSLDFQTPVAPPSAAILHTLDQRGLVRPTAEGALNPEGILVFAGKPPVLPQRRPAGLAPTVAPETEAAEAEAETPEDAAPVADPRLAGFKPAQRPSDLQERFERATQGGRSSAELARIRPQIRPDNELAKARDDAIARALEEAATFAKQAEARAAAEAAAQAELDKPTAQAVARSARPGSRPRNFARVVARARKADNPAAAASTAAISRGNGPAVARNSRAAPTGTTRASVARAATDNNAISLGKVALVGVFGKSSSRRALVRMPNGRFKKVGVGDRVDGGRVAAIGEGQLKYTKGGRTLTLQMPKG
ncbi:hypothetical protein [Litoreibacter albidus]|uniref:Type IV pilus biogenesis protein PilP n=1 Tax=Litoreibacter albidus TaxID=670155 RepID=A0A1H3B125_9RHOB|nr:hypothetical protein [Litoreibacter albidus]SDX35642.1 hypothetical protein SAMN04488001_3011 [Litoreibacter albidus]